MRTNNSFYTAKNLYAEAYDNDNNDYGDNEAQTQWSQDVKYKKQSTAPTKIIAPQFLIDLMKKEGTNYYNRKIYSGNRIYVNSIKYILSDAQIIELQIWLDK